MGQQARTSHRGSFERIADQSRELDPPFRASVPDEKDSKHAKTPTGFLDLRLSF
jgi:hypothetical protein